MPEGDRFDKKIRRGWSAAYDDIESGESTPEEAASELAIPLAQDLKNPRQKRRRPSWPFLWHKTSGGGFPGSDKIVDIVTACAGSEAHEDVFEALDRVTMQQGGHRHTVLLARAAKTHLLTDGMSESLEEPTFAECRLMGQACHDLVDNSFFGVGRYQLIESGRFASETEAREYETRVHEAMGSLVNRITEKLLADPMGRSIKVPRSRKPKPTTKDILEQRINLA